MVIGGREGTTVDTDESVALGHKALKGVQAEPWINGREVQGRREFVRERLDGEKNLFSSSAQL